MGEFKRATASRSDMLEEVARALREQLDILDREHLLAPAARLAHVLDMIEEEIAIARR